MLTNLTNKVSLSKVPVAQSRSAFVMNRDS